MSDSSMHGQKMGVSKFDQVVGLLLSLILFFGLFTAVLFVLWVLSRIDFSQSPITVVAVLEENPAGRGDHAEGFERDFDPPGADEVESLVEPVVQDTLTAVSDAVNSIAASLDAVDSQVNTANVGTGTGKGDSRPPGPEGEGDDIIPRGMRWRLMFSAKNVNGYAEQLDFFKIELALIGGGIEGVDYAANFSKAPIKRRGDSEKEKRLWFQWTDAGVFTQYDQALLTKSGLAHTGRNILMFIPKDLENFIAQMELEFAKKKGIASVKQIAKTVFQVEPGKTGFEFRITDQRYRVPKF